jgi:hypothetical protein
LLGSIFETLAVTDVLHSAVPFVKDSKMLNVSHLFPRWRQRENVTPSYLLDMPMWQYAEKGFYPKSGDVADVDASYLI